LSPSLAQAAAAQSATDSAATTPELLAGPTLAQGLALLAFGLAVAPLAVRAARWIHPGRNVFFARWGFSHVALALLVAAVMMASSSLVLAALEWTRPDTVQLLFVQSALMLPVAALIFGVANAADPDGWRSLGLRPGGWGRAVAVGVLAYLAALPSLSGLQALWRVLLDSAGIGYSEQELVAQARTLDGARLWAFAFLAVGVAPFLEELVFRAFLQPLLVQNLGDKGGVIAAAFLFALAHASFGAFLPLLALGIVLGSVMLRTQRLVAPWALHAAHNGLTLWLLSSAGAAGSPGANP
jgi:membrane protease YdiL (CAAX protease family)